MEYKTVVTLDESHPEDCYIPSGTDDVSFDNPHKAPVDEMELEQAIAAQPARFGVRGLGLAWNSQLETMRVARMFPKLEGVGCTSRRAKDLRALVGLDYLRSLGVTSDKAPERSLEVLPHLRLNRLVVDVWKKPDAAFIGKCGGRLELLWLERWREKNYASLAALECEHIRVTGGGAETSAGLNYGRLSRAWFAFCTKLSRFDGLRVQSLQIHACNRLEFASLGDVQGLRSLDLLSMKHMKSLDFIRGCQTLAAIAITATRIPIDRSAVIDSQSLRLAFLPLPNDQLLAIGRANRRLILGNGRIAVSDGELVPKKIYYDASHEFHLALKNGVS